MIVCTDRATELLDVEVDAVLKRRPASQGWLSMYGTEPVRAASAGEALLLRAAFDAAFIEDRRKSQSEDFVFLVEPDPEYVEDAKVLEGGLCRCIADQCGSGDWPTRLGHIISPTPSNPYRCWMAEQKNGQWRFLMR